LCQYCLTKPAETANKTGDETTKTNQPIPRLLTYQKVRDGRKQPIRGLWVRNGRFYARLTVEEPNTGQKSVRRVPVEGVKTIPAAVMEQKKLQTKREDNALPVLKRSPKFSDYVEEYFACYGLVKDAKRPRTLETERGQRTFGRKKLHDLAAKKLAPGGCCGILPGS
jgi:hypothetical protein